MAMGIDEILNQYKAKIDELLDISLKLGQFRKQKLEVEIALKDHDVNIADIKSRAAAATQPEEKQKFDALLNEALALRGQSESLLTVAKDNEEFYLESARKAKGQVQELSSKLQEGKDKK
jgi:hypothetical protein